MASVLIVGAGPTGLMTACQLIQFGIPIRIIDKAQAPTTRSKAVAVSSRSCEIYEQLGLASKAIELGVTVNQIFFVIRRKPVGN